MRIRPAITEMRAVRFDRTALIDGEAPLESESYLRCYRAGCNVVRSAERREKVVQRGSVRQVNEGDLCAPSVFVTVEEIVMANRQIEEMARRDTGWILVVILGSRSRNLHQRGSIL